MTLTTHALVGVAAARSFPKNPILAFSTAFVSHFLIDAIPHWDYNLMSFKKDQNNPLNNDIIFGRDFVLDLLNISFDVFLAFSFAFLIFGTANFEKNMIVFAGIMGGISPDFLQFIYFKVRKEPLISLQRFHQWIHTKWRLDDRWAIGIFLQVVLVAIVVPVLSRI